MMMIILIKLFYPNNKISNKYTKINILCTSKLFNNFEESLMMRYRGNYYIITLL